ncbi:ATP-binding protein [Streptomyces sp. NPDC053542]|uniref:ATP-binding protein n=1 Tax=Streptomyces sp. NPDC053542 TaxID=3365710 RepID=UPI0037D44960
MTVTRPHAIGAPGYSQTWRCEPPTVGRARSLVKTALNTWGLVCLVDRGELIVSELVTNSVEHSQSRVVRVSITRPKSALVVIAVSDRSKTPPAYQVPAEDAEGGRGLYLVDVTADCWETVVRHWGKIVRAELRVKEDG